MTLAKLFILGKEIELLWTDMNYHREIRMNGKPATDFIGGLITLCFATDRDTDIILRWMTKENQDNTWNEADKMEEGKVCFYENGFDYPPTKTYEFNDAHLIYFKETFNAEGEEPMQTILTISPAIQNYGVEFVKRWNVSWIPPSERMPYQAMESNDEPNFLNYHLEDIEDNRITKKEIDINEEFFIILKTEYAIGESINIDLEDKSKDFEYNGKHMKDDIIRNIKITDNITKIKIKAVEQKN